LIIAGHNKGKWENWISSKKKTKGCPKPWEIYTIEITKVVKKAFKTDILRVCQLRSQKSNISRNRILPWSFYSLLRDIELNHKS
jgi:hypothetical protein